MDPSRTRYGRFVPVRAGLGPLGHGWAGESPGLGDRSGPLRHPESLPWRRPETGQVLGHDEEDHCSGLWMRRGGGLVEVPLPGTEHFLVPRRGGDEEKPPHPGFPLRTDQEVRPGDRRAPPELRGPRPAR